MLEFEWDARKAEANEGKHAVAFAEASTVFGDPLSLTIPDPLHSEYEERFVTIGRSAQDRILIVVHADREGTVRLISARQATAAERRNYETRR